MTASVRPSNAAAPPWAQVNVTDVATARAFLQALRANDTLVLGSNDADVGYQAPATPAAREAMRFRGHGLTVATTIIAATPPPADLLDLHRDFGLGARRVYCPHVSSPHYTLAELVLRDVGLLEHLRADRSLTRMLISYKSPPAARLLETLGMTPVFCDPPPAAYERANDKLELARAGARHGFATLPTEPVTDETTLAARFAALGAEWGEGCILRRRRGAGGSSIHHARTLRAARRIWQRLAAGDREVLLVSYVPPRAVRRNVAVHGVVTNDGFAPFLFTDQILRGHDFNGGRAVAPWPPDEAAAVHAGLAGVARWFREVGYTGAPAGVDGFLMDGQSGPRFVVLDPNARLSATMSPWAAVAVLTEAVTRPLVWQLEGFRLIGAPFTLARVRRHLGADLLSPAAIERGGVLPTFLAAGRRGPIGACHLWAILLGHDASHLEHLRRRVRRLGIIAR